MAELLLLYTHLPYHNDSIIKTHAERYKENAGMKDARRTTHEDFFRKIFTSHFIARVRKGCLRVLHVRGCWGPNINFIF